MDKFNKLFEAYEDLTKVIYERGKITVVYLDEDERPPTSGLHEAITDVIGEIQWLFAPTDKLTLIAIRETVETDQMPLTEPPSKIADYTSPLGVE